MRNVFRNSLLARSIIGVLIFAQVFFLSMPIAQAEWDDVSSVAAMALSNDTTITLPIVGEVSALTVAMLGLAGFTSMVGGDEDTSLIDQIEERYNIDPSAIRDTSQTVNVANKKINYPRVDLRFSPNSPKVGTIETASATPVFFVNDVKKLYFTWYLKHEGCDAKAEDEYKTRVTETTPSYCDMDKDDFITPNDWKITAMKLIVLNGYNRNDPDLGINSAPQVDDDKDGYRAVFGGGDAVATKKWCYVADPNSGLAYELNDWGNEDGRDNEEEAAKGSFCGSQASKYFPNHLFPQRPGFTTGDGRFKTDEENAWDTDPNNPSTAHNGQKDEANVVGLGVDSFSWVYAAGDEIGVAVEGTSMIGTKHNDASSMIMWAFPLDACRPKEKEKSSYISTISGNNDSDPSPFPVTIHTAKMDHTDFDRCFADNLIDLSEGGQPTNMKMNVSSSPDNPVAQVFGPDDINPQGDTVTIQAQPEDSTKDPASIWYKWNIYLSTDGSMNTNFDDSASWALLNNKKAFIDNKQAGILEGNGRNEVSINLNFSKALAEEFPKAFSPENNVGYLYIKVSARENFSQNQGRAGTGFIVVKFNLLGKDHIVVSTVKPIDDENGITLVTRDQEICKNTKALAQCRLMQYQIIGVSVPESEKYDTFIWKINDQPLECNTRISPDCFDGKQGNEAFFPVLGNAGEQYVVTVIETDSQTGETVTLTRSFSIVNPAVEIVPAAEDGSSNVLPKLLGFYKNLDGTSFPDYSPDTFEAAEGKTITLKSLFNADNLQGNTKLLWLVDDVAALHVDPETGILTLPVEKQSGSVIKVSIKGIYYQPQVIRKALQDIWNISPDVSVETNFENTIAINVGDFGESDTSEGDYVGFLSVPNRYLGALLSYIPESVLFGFRLALTLAFALFLVGFAQSFLPETVVRKE